MFPSLPKVGEYKLVSNWIPTSCQPQRDNQPSSIHISHLKLRLSQTYKEVDEVILGDFCTTTTPTSHNQWLGEINETIPLTESTRMFCKVRLSSRKSLGRGRFFLGLKARLQLCSPEEPFLGILSTRSFHTHSSTITALSQYIALLFTTHWVSPRFEYFRNQKIKKIKKITSLSKIMYASWSHAAPHSLIQFQRRLPVLWPPTGDSSLCIVQEQTITLLSESRTPCVLLTFTAAVTMSLSSVVAS